MPEIVAARTMTSLYIVVDIIVLLFLSLLLLWQKKRLTFYLDLQVDCCIFWSITEFFICFWEPVRWRARRLGRFCFG